MSDRKGHQYAAGYDNKSTNNNGRADLTSPLRGRRANGLIAPNGKNMGGWDAYRRWLTQVQAPDARRMPLDPTLYTWKGYRSWAEQVRRDWEPDSE